MAQNNAITIFTIPNYDALFELRSIEVNLVTMPLQEMVKAFLETGKENDICMLPYISQYKSLLATFRAKKRKGAVVFVTNKPVEPNTLDDIYRRGAILIDVHHERPVFVKFLILFLAEALQKQDDTGQSDYIQMALALESSYKTQRTPAKEPEAAPNAEVQNLLQEATEAPERLSFPAILKDKQGLDSKFMFTFEVKTEGAKTVSLSCMAHLKAIKPHPLLANQPMLVFRDFHPPFATDLLLKIAGQPELKVLTEAVASKTERPDNAVQLGFSCRGNSRNCLALPVLIEDNEVGFLPIGDAFLQKRRFVRIEPSGPDMITAFVAVDGLPTHKATVIDISEQGLAFWLPALLPLASEVLVYIHWSDIDIVGRGITRFAAEIKGRNKIGIELLAHDHEYARLGEQIFRHQLEMFKSIRGNL